MKTAVLVFDEYPDEEITVRLSPVTLDDFDAIVELYEQAAGTILPKDLRALFDAWAPVALESWTFPEPASAAGMGKRDPNLGLAIVGEWIVGVRTAPLPLPARSSASAGSEDRSPQPSTTPSSATPS